MNSCVMCTSWPSPSLRLGMLSARAPAYAQLGVRRALVLARKLELRQRLQLTIRIDVAAGTDEALRVPLLRERRARGRIQVGAHQIGTLGEAVGIALLQACLHARADRRIRVGLLEALRTSWTG
eukprot:COSAG01_NODE_19_length_39011_cov_38.134968_11_plen_124_part_00